MYKEYKGIILKSIPYSESSIISRIYTPDLGKISTMALGAKKNKKATVLEPMNQQWLVVQKKIKSNNS